ncbi:MAG: Gfo/Idh/MocA family oxidoreductase [Bryobacterales bacterium]|nr:Gfo/Idh/MocA family oxidoreductase [Bryobacterales bacterium]
MTPGRDETFTTRRQLVTTAALAAPYVVASRVFGANDRIRVGFIGAGGRANLLMDQLPEQGEIAAVADCYQRRASQSAAKRKANWKIHQDYRRILDDKDVDGVVIATGDHQRVLPSIHACQAGKDVYAEKPLTLYISEGRALVNAVRKYNRVFQVGSQQRSMAMNQVACKFVREGGLGRILFGLGINYSSAPPYPGGIPEEPVPEDLNWDVWLNQTPMRTYNRKLQFGWMGWQEFSGGEMTNWGAHGLDQVQWAMGMDTSGPRELWPFREGPKGALAFKYANGVIVALVMTGEQLLGGAMFVGEKGRIEIVRNGLRTDPPGMIKDLPPEEEVQKWNRAQWQAKYHMREWMDCMRSRKRPSADVEIGHRSVSLCHLCNITRALGRKLIWNPDTERFAGDEEANRWLSRPRRKGYELPSEFDTTAL